MSNPDQTESRLFVLHMMITSVLAPCLGFAMTGFFWEGWQDSSVFLRLGGTVIAGVYYAIIVFPVSLLLGVIAYPFCTYLRASRWDSAILWGIIGSLVGVAFGGFIVFAEANKVFLELPLSAIIGLAAGLALWWLWIPTPSRPMELSCTNDTSGL